MTKKFWLIALIVACTVVFGSCDKSEELSVEQCDFIRSYTPFGKSKKDMMYQLIDPYCLFYFKFMHNKDSFLDNYWVKMQTIFECFVFENSSER